MPINFVYNQDQHRNIVVFEDKVKNTHKEDMIEVEKLVERVFHKEKIVKTKNKDKNVVCYFRNML